MPQIDPHAQITAQIKPALADAGFDIVHPFDVSAYNATLGTSQKLVKLPDFGRTHALALLIGNTKVLWDRFVADCSARYARINDIPQHPLNEYAEHMITKAVGTISIDVEIRFGHETGTRFVSLLHATKVSGFAEISPVHLAIHPDHGLWFALRAVAIFDCPVPPTPPPLPPTPCRDCPAPCKTRLDNVLARHAHRWPACSWEEHVSVRDACPVANHASYSDDQITYHYAKDISLLTGPGKRTQKT